MNPPKMRKMMGSTARPGEHVDHGETQPATLVQMTLIKAAVPTSPSCQLTTGDTVPQEVQGCSFSASWKASQAQSRDKERAMRTESPLTHTAMSKAHDAGQEESEDKHAIPTWGTWLKKHK